jgi:hypothetical protein
MIYTEKMIVVCVYVAVVLNGKTRVSKQKMHRRDVKNNFVVFGSKNRPPKRAHLFSVERCMQRRDVSEVKKIYIYLYSGDDKR